jgi:hypothetical protein
MTDGKPKVLVAGVDDALARRVVVALAPLGADFQRRSWASAFGRLAPDADCDVAIVGHFGDLSGLELLVETTRSEAAHSRQPALVVLCRQDLLGEVAPLEAHGVSRVVAIEELDHALYDAVASLLAVAPRVSLQAPVRLMPTVSGHKAASDGKTENLSASGMLVSCLGQLPVGSTVRFEISIPGHATPIRGSARIVRTADPEREGVRGIGARFLSFLKSDGDRFRHLLSDQLN